jgi:hypothetical protein
MSEPITSEDLPDYGPRMAALKPKHRAFVSAYFDDRAGSSVKARLIFAAATAGYGGEKTKNNPRNLEYLGWRVSSYPEVNAAMEEEGRRRNRLVLPIAITAARAVLADPKHRDHGKLVLYYLSLIDPPAATLDLKVEHVPPSLETMEAVKARIAALAASVGAAVLASPAVIDGDCVEVGND